MKEDRLMVRSTLTLAAVLSVASASLAADLVTPPIFVGVNNFGGCRLANITSMAIPAQIQLVGESGNVVVDTGPITVQGGAAIGWGSTGTGIRFR
jgi:hypothetical protein